MKLEPIISEKSLKAANEGKYTFRVSTGLNKFQIKELIEKTFGVNVVRVSTINRREERRRSVRGKVRIIKPSKKAIVQLKEKQKIDIFDTKKEK